MDFKGASSRPWMKVLDSEVGPWKCLKSSGICFIGLGNFLLGNVKYMPSVGFFDIHILLNLIVAGALSWTLLGKLTALSQTLSCCRKVLEKSLKRSLNSKVTEDGVRWLWQCRFGERNIWHVQTPVQLSQLFAAQMEENCSRTNATTLDLPGKWLLRWSWWVCSN